MITIFSCPKSFSGAIDVIQRNAIKSWLLLKPQPQILLIGNDTGTQSISKELGVKHIPDIESNEYGTPLVNSIFRLAQKLAAYDILCYVNADIILTSDFMRAVLFVKNKKDKFLMVGRRWDVEIEKSLNFEDPDWQEAIKSYSLKHGSLHAPTGIDYFVFSKGVFSELPPFALGRTMWDCWLIYYARSLGIPVIDATGIIWAFHQNHQYPLHLGGRDGIWKGKEAKQNLELSKGLFRNISNATHHLTTKGLDKRSLYLSFEPLLMFAKKMIHSSRLL